MMMIMMMVGEIELSLEGGCLGEGGNGEGRTARNVVFFKEDSDGGVTAPKCCSSRGRSRHF